VSVEKRLLQFSVCCPFFICVYLRTAGLDLPVLLDPVLFGSQDVHDSVQPLRNACELKLQVLMIASQRCKLASEIAPLQFNISLGLLRSTQFSTQITVDL